MYGSEKAEKVAIEKSKGKTVFVIPYDQSNVISASILSKVKVALKADLSEKPILLTAKQVGIDD